MRAWAALNIAAIVGDVSFGGTAGEGRAPARPGPEVREKFACLGFALEVEPSIMRR